MRERERGGGERQTGKGSVEADEQNKHIKLIMHRKVLRWMPMA